MAPLASARQSTPRETAASVGVLLLLVALIGWLWSRQRQFSPAVTVAAGAALAAEATRGVMAPSSPAAAADLFAAWPAGLKPMSPAEAFTPATLSDKIDGKAELYLSAGFVAMRCQRVAIKPTAWFEAFIYDLGKPENAFSVYSSQKRHETQDAGLGDYSYRAGNQLCLVHGNFYLELVGANESDATLQGATALARSFIATTTVARHANLARDEALFPADGRVDGTVMLLSADVFGFDQLNNTYVARYREGSETVTLFLSRRANPADAVSLAASTRRFFIDDCGGTETSAPAAPSGASLIDGGGAFDGVFASGVFVAGVHQAPSREAAERWMQHLATRLQTSQP